MFKKIYFLFFLGIINSENSMNLMNLVKKASNLEIKVNASVASNDIDPKFSITADSKFPKDNNREYILSFSPLNLFKSERLPYLERNLLFSVINSKGDLVAPYGNLLLADINREVNEGKVGYLENLIADEFKESFLGRLFNFVEMTMKSYSVKDGSFFELMFVSLQSGGFFNKFGEFNHIGSLFLEEDFFSSNASFVFGIGKIINNQHIIGIKFLSDLDKWNTILREVFIVESFKLIVYGALQFNEIKFLASCILSANYDKLKIIELYKDYDTHGKDIEFSTLDSFKPNIIIPLSLSLFIFQLEGVYNYAEDKFVYLGKIKLLDMKKWKILFNLSNSIDYKDLKEEISNLYKKQEKLNMNVSFSYTVDGHTFTLKIKGNVGNEKFTMNPFSSSNNNLKADLLKYIVPLIKLSYKYETQPDKKRTADNEFII